MDAPPTDLRDLLDRLRAGDSAAAEAVFRAYEPYLRVVVRRQLTAALRAKFDSADVVQSVWATLLRGFREGGWRFPDTDHLRAFLVKATRNRLIDRIRRHLHELECEEPLRDGGADGGPVSAEPDPCAAAEAGELWERLQALCTPAHAEVLRLKRQGWPLAEIAARTGFHESSVRRILYDLALRLAAQPGHPADS
jgi:RNA polymerase sigma-70 factor (ECF subfamily)